MKCKKKRRRSRGPPPYQPPLKFPQRQANEKLEQNYSKIINMMKIMNVNIPFYVF